MASGSRNQPLREPRTKGKSPPSSLGQHYSTRTSAPGAPPRAQVQSISPSLPARPTRLIGRESELGTLTAWLHEHDVRLLTLTGPPGIGKTRLAVEVAHCLAGEFGDGAFFVDLTPIRDHALVASTVARTLGVREAPDRPILKYVLDFLAEKHILLVLDSFEQVIDAAPDVAALLDACPGVKILVTSREPLHLRWEREFPVASLTVPDLTRLPDPRELTVFPAIALFVDRARAVRPNFALDAETGPAVAEICARLDGLPLAIEMAAALVKALSPQTIVQRLERPLDLLRSSGRGLPRRHQTLRLAIAWSYELLPPSEQALFRRLAVFARGCTLETAAAVCDVQDQTELIERLVALVDKSLLLQEPQPDGSERFRVLESLRDFGLEQLSKTGELETTGRRHAEFFLEVAARAESGMRGADQKRWLNLMETEHDNFRAALAWALRGGDPELALGLAAALHWFWFLRGYLSEGRRWLDRVLSTSPQPSVNRARALTAAGLLAWAQGDYSQAAALLQDGLALSRHHGATWEAAYALHFLAHVADSQGNPARAVELYEESLKIFRETTETWGIALTLSCMGRATSRAGDYPRAMALLEESQAFFRELGDLIVFAHSLYNFGAIAVQQGDSSKARPLLEEGLHIYSDLGDRIGVAESLNMLARLAHQDGQHAPATARYGDSLRLARDIGHKQAMAASLAGLTELAAEQRQPERAVRLFSAAEGLRTTINAPWTAANLARYDQMLARLRLKLGDSRFSEAWAAGQAMPLGKAVEEALASPVSTSTPSSGRPSGPLTRRESEVAALIAQGLSNRQIAVALYITERTVETHVQNMLNKLGFHARTQIAAWASVHGLHYPPR